MEKTDVARQFDAAPNAMGSAPFVSVAVESDGTDQGVRGDFVTDVAQLAGYMDILSRSGGWRSIRVERLKSVDVLLSSDGPSIRTPS